MVAPNPNDNHLVVSMLRFVMRVAQGGPYDDLTPHEQHLIKMDLISQMNLVLGPAAEPFIKKWAAFPVVMDSMYHDTIPTLTDLIDQELLALSSQLGTSVERSDQNVPMGCIKTPDNGHHCLHGFVALLNGNPWRISSELIDPSDPVVADLWIELAWDTPGVTSSLAGPEDGRAPAVAVRDVSARGVGVGRVPAHTGHGAHDHAAHDHGGHDHAGHDHGAHGQPAKTEMTKKEALNVPKKEGHSHQ